MSVIYVNNGLTQITAATFAELEQEVRKYEAKGWVPHTPPYTHGRGEQADMYNIVMKRPDATDEGAK